MSPTPDRTLDDLQQTIADLKRQLAESNAERDHLRSERDEALEQQTATTEVLQVINSSPGDLAPVFEAMLEKAMRLCGIDHGAFHTYDGQLFRAVAVRGLPEPLAERLRQGFRPGPNHPMRPVLDGAPFVHIPDLTKVDQSEVLLAVEYGSRTLLFIPLRKGDALIGQIVAVRQEVRPFTDKQIALLQNFAAQAVIAMENARLLTETREALEQQTATAEVLGVINSSPGDLAPVFDAILEKAHSLCGADFGSLLTYDGEFFRRLAAHGPPGSTRYAETRYAELMGEGVRPGVDDPFARLVRGERLVHDFDLAEAAATATRDRLPFVEALVEIGIRTQLVVPLRKDDRLLGAITANRQEVRPFSDKQIALLQNFAAQAVIAMENARLLTETREALEQQTATAEVLQVINSSPGDLAPVFDAMLDKAMRLCEAAFGLLLVPDGELQRAIAHRALPPALAEYFNRPVPGGVGLVGRLQAGEAAVQVADAADDEIYRVGAPTRRALVDLGGARTAMAVALRKDGAYLGAFWLYRREVSLFTEVQIALLQNFAAQAVIAMENARLITETREALEQQTATAEVLGVINSSPGDLTPVFDAVLDKALRLCDAAFGHLLTFDGERFGSAAVHGEQRLVEHLRQRGPIRTPTDGASLLGRIVVGGEHIVQSADLLETNEYHTAPHFREFVDIGGYRSLLNVALRKENVLFGVIVICRKEVRPFSDKQIALLENFAAQAVIAMENARLITETREALAQQTATAEVLQVINSSPGDLAPVFQAMLQKAHTLCEASFGALMTYDGEWFYPVAHQGTPALFREFLASGIRPGRGDPFERIVAGAAFSHIHDLSEVAARYPDEPLPSAAVDLGGIRSLLVVPLRKDSALLGVITAYRQEVRPFTDKQIALLQNFAEQAVIAMENARLLTETREALEQQTATAEVLQVINSSPGDLAPVFDAILEKAHNLCAVTFGSLQLYEAGKFRAVAVRGMAAPLAELLRQPTEPQPGTPLPLSRLVDGEPIVQVHDLAELAEYYPDDPRASAVAAYGFRTALFVALRKDAGLLGCIAAFRQEAQPFSEKEIALLQNFSAQAVIAMENARLITETREALEQQTATAELLGVINTSPGNLTPVFEAMLEKAIRLCGGIQGALWTLDGGRANAAASHGNTPEFVAMLRERERAGLGPPEAVGLTMRERLLHIPDLVEHELYRGGEAITKGAVELSGVRSLVGVALVKDGASIGAFMIGRREVRPFSDKQIALLQNFAAQAVIAMDNARLLDEIRQRQAELRVTFDNMGDGVAMFDAALRLAAWNMNFQRILDLPGELLAERLPYADYIRFLARRGEFGSTDIETDLSRRLEGLGQELRFEHNRPDGRIIEVRRNAVPGGGFVVIYGDVTERKRAEEEIRVARDTAERALQELKTTQASLLHAQKMAALGQLTAGIAHEIKNPLNFVNNFAELSGELLLELKETTAPVVAALGEDERAAVDEVVDMLRGNLDKIAEHGKRADGIVKSMLEHSRGVSGERRAVDLNGLVEEALNLAYHGARAQDASFNITLEREFDRGLTPMELAPQEMTRVFLNLFGNGFYATSKRQRDGARPDFRPTLKVATRDLGEVVEVRVRDNGTGIAPEIRDKLFQPFVTTKPTGEGTGLGLSIAYDIVTQQHGGTIKVDSRVDEFTEFTVRLPRTRHAATTSDAT